MGSLASTSCVMLRGTMPILSCGHAFTQSMHSVQSALLRFSGRYNSNSQPRCCSLPRMQSRVAHVLQVEALRTCNVVGEISDPTKLNCPMGQTYLQKLAPSKIESTTSAPRM